ncbi:MAG TPA: alpha/beta fold hydrolase [Holophaga sp.]|nr:alpha/beta fold hydrolase [Holophaga sp.]
MPLPADDPSWQPFSAYPGDGIGVLVSHGFTGSPGSVRHLAQRLAEAGCNVELPLLTGHTPHWRDMVSATMEDWLEDLRVPLGRLKGRSSAVYAVGLSMGGALVLRLAQEDPSIRGLALINHALVLGNPLVPLAGLLKHILPSTPAIASDIMDPAVREPSCDRTPTAGVAQLHRLTRLARRGLPAMRQPLLVLKSRQDHVLSARNATLTMREAGSPHKELVWLERSYHVATLDHDKDLVADTCLDFFQRIHREQP